ncbi:MAG TPA: S8 family serine peptidase [Puia sp.]|nr:S8 family serine peptidase [Puia sp.]
MIASTRYGWPKTALSAFAILLLALSCHCRHGRPIDIGWIGNPGYQAPDTNRFPLKYQVVVWKNPDSSKEQYQRWLSDLKKEVPNVQALAVCSHCDSDMILLYDSTLLPYLQNQTVGGSGGTGSPGPSGNNGPTLYCSNYSVGTHDSARIDTLRRSQFPPRIATNYTWPKPTPAGVLTIAVFDSGLDSVGSSVVATVGSTCFETPSGTSSSHGWNFVDNNANTQDDMPDKHGTKVTKIILNQVQQYGGGNVDILPVKIFNSNGQGTLFGMLCGFAYASGAGARIVNASWGFYHYAQTDTAGTLKVENMLGAFMNKYLNATGMLLVAAAGNDDPAEDAIFGSMDHTSDYRYLDSNRFYPASFAKTFPNIVTVTTVSQRTQKPSPLENASGNLVDVGAQCDTITPDGSYVFYDPINPPKNVGGGYIVYTITGSSFAAPVVTGRIAALYSHLTSKTDKHVIIPAMNTTANGRTVLTIDKALTDSIVHGELAP